MAKSLRIITRSVDPVVDPGLALAINIELENIYGVEVDADSLGSEPPAAGFTEIAFTIVATGLLGLVFEFFKPLVTAAGEAYRDEVLRLIRGSRRSKESGRGYVPLLISFGGLSEMPYPMTPVRYFFHDKIDDEELLKRLRAADDHIRTIPPDLFAITPGPPENAFFWDTEEERWRGSIQGYREEFWGEQWSPHRLFDLENDEN